MSGRHSKRSRSAKHGASTSAAPPRSNYPYQDGSVLYFNSDIELTRFVTKFEKRDILPPRFSTHKYLESFGPVANMLQNSQLLDFLLLTHPYINTTLVQAFYSNLHEDEDGDLVTNINGVQILLTDENFHTIARLPHNGEDIFRYTGEAGALFDETALLHQIGLTSYDPKISSRRPTITGMDPNYRLIFYFITRVLKPRKHNHTTISQEDTKLMHAIITGANINWCRLIKIHMRDAIGDDRPLPYALLIMNFLEATGFVTGNGPLKKSTKKWEISESSFHHDGDHAASAPPPIRRPRAPQEPTLQSISDQIASLTSSFGQLTHEIHGYFDHVHYPYAGLVPFEAAPDDEAEDDE